MRLVQRLDGDDSAELHRMAHWAAIALALYVVAYLWSPSTEAEAGLQSTVYHYGNLTARAFIGYWIGRGALGRVERLYVPKSVPDAIVLAAKIIGRALIMFGVIETSK